VPPLGEVTTNTVHSKVTTSKDDYDKAGSGIPIIGGALAALGLGGAAAKKENLIPESSLPMGEGADKSLDAGPTISSAGAGTTTADLAGKVPLEENKVTAETVPEAVKESIKEAHVDPEATTSAEAVKEKAEVEQELLKKVPEHDETGEPAPTIAAASSPTAPAATTETAIGAAPGQSSVAAATVADGADGEKIEAPKTTVVPEKTEGDNTEYAPPHSSSAAPGVSGSAAAAVSDGAEDPTLLEEPAVQMGLKNDAEAAGTSPAAEPAAATTADAPKETPAAATTEAPEAKKEEVKAAAPTSATSTPKKATDTTPSTTPTTSASASKDKKKKHRVSSFFKKIFD
jgi:hypothetical protein